VITQTLILNNLNFRLKMPRTEPLVREDASEQEKPFSQM
jgi:hypothetical protein